MARTYEKEFLTHLGKVFRQRGHAFFKIPDSYGMERFGIKRPFDAFVSMWGKAVGIEAKFLKSPQAFGKRHLRAHQIDHLVEVSRSGGLGIVCLEMRVSRGVYRWFFWEIEQFLNKTECGSIPKKDLLCGERYVERRTRGWYNLDVFEGTFFPAEEKSPKDGKGKRKCLVCGKKFSSKSPINRVCQACRGKPERDIIIY